ncbi:hypothetical protein MRX96_054605 [Rhipicephalus microplus]
MAKRFLYLVQGLLLCVPNVSPGSTTATTGYSPHSHHFPFCKSQPPHVEPCDVIPKLLPPGSAWNKEGQAARNQGRIEVRKKEARLRIDRGDPPRNAVLFSSAGDPPRRRKCASVFPYRSGSERDPARGSTTRAAARLIDHFLSRGLAGAPTIHCAGGTPAKARALM